ncbi:AAA family ATPase [Streptacidiphilus sp. N1-3]|uniref:Nuclease SbcCD subunit C n=1 Tax=Streptacidiphilus alkalitolerans TaxID=3342712 RepID=A0ABV6WTC2_9ACTN
MTTAPIPSSAPPSSLLTDVNQRLDAASLAPDVAALVRDALQGLRLPQGAPVRGVYLASVTAEGFRGIGPAATLDLPPGPGLTIVQGRNGSGKSSFAEGIEVAVTGHNRRWEDDDGKVVQGLQRDGWRNLHHTVARRLELQLQVSGRTEPVVITRSWSGDAFDESTAAVTGLGPAAQPLTALGWEEDLRAFRPILSYSELGQMMTAKPSRMYDKLAPLLGLGPLAEASERLAAREHQLQESDKQAKAALAPLQEALQAALATAEQDDERIQEAATALRERIPDRERVRSLVAGTPLADGTELSRLHRVALLTGPDPEVVAAAAARLREALARAEDVRHSDAAVAQTRAELLDRVLRLRAQHPSDHTCPVCRAPDRLDDAWVAAASTQAELLREQAAAALAAQRELRGAADDLRSLVQNRPAGLPQALHQVWDEWVACRRVQDLAELASTCEKQVGVLADACRHLREEARRRLAAQDEQWRQAAPKLAAWLELADAAVAAKPVIAQVKKARNWLKVTLAALRDERMLAIAESAQQVWGYLSQESNVALGAVNLTGSDAYSGRGVQLNVTVDDLDASALGVVSQGELFSLALALFLPRATSEQSPFDFIVIDDPVQSMDPRKVEGLARLLGMIAENRQVVVFSHDTRLPDALRFQQISATVLEVGRHERSLVTVRRADDPVKRELDAARAVAKDRRVPAAVLNEVLPGQCRLALEAALYESARRALLGAGLHHRAVEQRIAEARELTDLAALALFREPRSKDEVYREINRRCGAEAGRVIGDCNKGAHTTLAGMEDAKRFITRVAAAAKELREL